MYLFELLQEHFYYASDNSATTFLDNLLGDHYVSLLQQTGLCIYGWIFHSCSKISNTTYAMSTAKRISLRQPVTSILLIYFGDLYSSIQNLRDLELLAERQKAAHPFYNCIYSHYNFQHKGFLSTQAIIKLLSWKPSISSFDSFYFPFNITRR